MSFADKVLSFYSSLFIDSPLPKGVGVLNPYRDKEAFALCQAFYTKYYHDNNPRYIIIGINPGRHGGGLTGIPFTDPLKLEKLCGIPNDMVKKAELSADYIYTMIAAYGGLEKFYGRFYFNSVSPLGFVKDGKNLNYYDTPELLRSLEPFIVKSLRQQLDFGIGKTVAFCLGEGENYKYLARLNMHEKLFENIVPLAHPRFIMQYRRKRIDEFVKDYLSKLNAVKLPPV